MNVFGLLQFLAALGLAVALHVLGLRIHKDAAQFFDPFLILALYRSLRQGPALSMLAGTVVGLAHDALSGGLYGLHGFASTLAAYLTSKLQIRMMIHQLSQVALLLLLASALHQAMLGTLQFLMVPAAELPGVLSTLIKMATTSLFGTAIYAAVDRFEAWREQRRDKRSLRPSFGR